MLRKLSSRADPQNKQFDGGFHGHHFFDPFLGTQKTPLCTPSFFSWGISTLLKKHYFPKI
jgi:hypothetical protein